MIGAVLDKARKMFPSFTPTAKPVDVHPSGVGVENGKEVREALQRIHSNLQRLTR